CVVPGAGGTAVMIMEGRAPWMATILGAVAGFVAGCITGISHTKGNVNKSLSGILMMIALYSINLRIMDSPQISLMNDDTLKTQRGNIWDSIGIDGVLKGMLEGIGAEKLPATWGMVMIMWVVIFFMKILTDYFLKTEVGLALRATGDNQRMIRSFSANTDILIILGIGLSNGLVALSGALIAQHGGFADAGMGIGMIIIGLASVIIGEAL